MSGSPLGRRTALTSSVTLAASLSSRPASTAAQGTDNMDAVATKSAPVTSEVVLSVSRAGQRSSQESILLSKPSPARKVHASRGDIVSDADATPRVTRVG